MASISGAWPAILQFFSGYFNDSLDRATQVRRAVGTSIQNQTSFSYDDSGKSVTTTSDQTSNNDNALKTQTFYDGFGRTTETRAYEGGTNYVSVQTQYDPMGRAYKTSNPFRPWQSESAIWTTSAFDAVSRVTSITTPDSAVATTSYSGNTVTVSDQLGKARKSVTDALGRLTTVYEDPSGLNYQTSYSYDVLDDLTQVSQGSQTRTFVYNSLKQLMSATNPESGTVSYQYDANGNLTQKTDARGVVTTFGTYDVLNRPTTKSYSDGTPNVTYNYDTATNGKGCLASVGSTVSTYSYGSYDALGRALTASQTLGSQTYSMSYAYDFAGHVTSMTYPSGRTVSYGYDSAGRTASFSGYLGDGTNRTYSTGIAYSPFGGLTQEQLGTTTALFNKLYYNSRGQLSEIREGITGGDTNWERGAIINHYSNSCWGMCGGNNSTTAMTDNNGNVKKQEHWIQDGNGNVTAIFTQQYDYDSLNRLQKAYDGTNWQQQYVYDRYGNRTIDQANTFGGGIPKPNFGVDTSTNRLTPPSGYTMSYDAAGNLTFDNSDGFGGTRTYDAENRMKQAWANSQWQTYTYDGDGRRVKRVVNGTETWQVYGIGGEALAEYAANASPLSPQKEYGYRNGQLLVTAEPSANMHYLIADQLGTPRMIFDQSGSLATTSRHDYLPFGEELSAGTGGRTTAQGYSASDGVRQHFTGQRRDNETGLDYFLARYYSSTQGRFTSPDEFSGGPREVYMLGSGDPEKQALPYAEITNPQSLNKYQYAYNNPLLFVDPDGHQGILDSIQRYAQALIKRYHDLLDPQGAAEEQRPRSPGNSDWGAVVEGHAQAMGQAAEIAWNVASVADITGVGSVFHGTVTHNRGEVALGMVALPLSEIFSTGKGAVTSGELIAGRVGKAEVLAQFSKEGDTLVAGIAALFNNAKGLARESASQQLFKSISAFAKEQGLSKVEVQAIAVVNPSLERKLVNEGFQKTTVRVLGQDVPAYTKTFNVK